MDRKLGPFSAPALAGAGAVPQAWPARDGLAGAPTPGHDLDRMAEKLNDVVVRRIFAAGLDLQAALGLLGECGPARVAGAPGGHPAASKIWHATDELDHAIKDLRDILFEPR